MSDQDWRTIETAPDGTAVLLFSPAWDMLKVGIAYDGTRIWQQPDGDLLEPPTHWAPLPSCPDPGPASGRR